MDKLTDEQARAYILGEEFDALEYERQHILLLAKSVRNALAELNHEHYGNLRKTAARYIENHKDTPHTAELGELVQAFNEIKEA